MSVKKVKKPPASTKTTTRLFAVVVSRVVSDHATEREARVALKKLKPQQGAIGIVLKLKEPLE